MKLTADMIAAIEDDAASEDQFAEDELSRNVTPETSGGPFSSVANYTALRASDCYSYGKGRSALVKYVGETVEAPVAKVATAAHHTIAPAIKFVDACLNQTTSVVCKPAWFVVGLYGKMLQTCDTTIDYFLPSPSDPSPSNVSVRACVSKVCTRLPLAVLDGAAYGRQAVLSAPSRACDLVCGKTLVIRDGVYAQYTQVCDRSKAVLHTTIETVNGQTTAAFTLVQNGVRSCVVVPISSSLLWVDGKLGLSRAVSQASEMFSRRLLRISITEMLAAKTAQLTNAAAEVRCSLQEQIDVLLAVLHLSSKPATVVPVAKPCPSVPLGRTTAPAGDVHEEPIASADDDWRVNGYTVKREAPVLSPSRPPPTAAKNPSPPKYPRLRARPTPTTRNPSTPPRTSTPLSRRTGSCDAEPAPPVASADSYLQKGQAEDRFEPFQPFVLRFG
jgi:hypothetical protein